MVIFHKCLSQNVIKICIKTLQNSTAFYFFSGEHSPKPPSKNGPHLVKSWLRPCLIDKCPS